MNSNVNLSASLGVMAFLGTAFVLGLAVILLLHALSQRKSERARLIGGVALSLTGLYLALLFLFSFISRERVLAVGEEKHFCEIDCHLAYSIANVQKTKTLGSASEEATARGLFYVVTIKTRFDEQTIGEARGDGPLTPNSRVVTITDKEGNVYEASPEGTQALEATQAVGTPLTTPVRPGESYMTALVFDLPADVNEPKLLIREGEFITHFIIGHENSFWHTKTEFRLES